MTVDTSQHISSPLPLRNLSWRENLFIAAAALVVLGVVANVAWLSEDCFITLRYVSNTTSGYGPVFNVGEHVQGYTHPLWFCLLLVGSLIVPYPMFVAYAFSFIFTLITVALVGRSILRAAPTFLSGAILLSVAAAVWALSDPWVSFQTGGLENSLSNLLIVLIVRQSWIQPATRPARLMLLLGLLCLTRPDFVVWVAPLAVLLLVRIRSLKQSAFLALALVPVAAWLLFALFFYHDIFPNTFYAKVGIYPNLADAIAIGWTYLQDWLHYDVLAAGSTLLFLAFAAFRARTWQRIALLAGIALYAIWIIEVGGDFMRGRLFVSVLTASIFTGSLALAEQFHWPGLQLDLKLLALGVVLTILFVAWLIIPQPPIDVAHPVIVNERQFYPGYSLAFLLKEGHLENPLGDLGVADLLRNYARQCGPVTIHMFNPGTVGYLAGPDVSVIDLLGLTDAFIAHLPRESLANRVPRPGHPVKRIPYDYLISRKDIKLLPNWVESVENGQCGLSSQVEKFKPSGNGAFLPE